MIAGLLAVAISAGAAPDTAAPVLRAIEDAGRALRTMSASFVETKALLLLDEKQVSRGTVALQVPGRFRWDYQAPQEGVMIIKDGRFTRYFPKSKQVFRGEAKGEADLLVGFGPGAANLGKKYEVTLLPDESVGGVAAHVVDLKPRLGQGASGAFAEIRLWVEKARHIPIQTRLTEPTGDHITIRFDGVAINGRLPSGTFDLKLPKDVVEVR